MNSGKTHAYFAWAANEAWVPPHAPSSKPYTFSYSERSTPAPPLAPHDPRPPAKQARANWVRPDFVLKADDDAFIMLAELEARLRIELHDARAQALRDAPPSDPLSYWGYLVKNKFMAGEMYGMTLSLAQWVASEPKLRGMVRGAEDKQVRALASQLLSTSIDLNAADREVDAHTPPRGSHTVEERALLDIRPPAR